MEAYERYNRGQLLNERYLKVEDISEGSYGLVSLAKDTLHDNTLVAVKYIYPPDYERAKHYKELLKKTGRATSSPAKLRSNIVDASLRERTSVLNALNEESSKEIRIHQILGDHPNVTQLVDHFGPCLVLEYCPRGDLYEAIQSDVGPSTSQDIKDVFLQILNALTYCHLRLVYHRDLKPENILIAADWLIKLCDWGLATTTRIITARNEFDIGSERYMAPELFDGEATSYDAAKVDLWAAGIILLTLVFRKNPFQVANYTDKRFLQFSANREALFDFFSTMSGELFAALRFLLTIDPANRDLASLTHEVESLRYFTIDEEYWAEHSDEDTGYEEDDDKKDEKEDRDEQEEMGQDEKKDESDDEMFLFDRERPADRPALGMSGLLKSLVKLAELEPRPPVLQPIKAHKQLDVFDTDSDFTRGTGEESEQQGPRFVPEKNVRTEYPHIKDHLKRNLKDDQGHFKDTPLKEDHFKGNPFKENDYKADHKNGHYKVGHYREPDHEDARTASVKDDTDDRMSSLYDMPHNRRAEALLGAQPIPIGGLRLRNTRKPFGVASYNRNGRSHNAGSVGARFRREDFFTPRSVVGHYMDKYGEAREAREQRETREKRRKWNRGRKKQSWKKKPEHYRKHSRMRRSRAENSGYSSSTQNGQNGLNVREGKEGREKESNAPREGMREIFRESRDRDRDNSHYRDSSRYRDSQSKDRENHSPALAPSSGSVFSSVRRNRMRSPRSPHISGLAEDFDHLALTDGEVFQLDFDESDRHASATSYGSPTSVGSYGGTFGTHFANAYGGSFGNGASGNGTSGSARRNLDVQGKYIPPNRRGSVSGARDKRRSFQSTYASIHQTLEESAHSIPNEDWLLKKEWR